MSKLRIMLFAAALILIASVSSTMAQAQGQPVLQLAQNDGQLNTFVELAYAADLGEMFSANGPFTILVPTDAAFSAMPTGELERLYTDPGYARHFLLYHTLQGDYTSADLGTLGVTTTGLGKDMTLQGIEGGDVLINYGSRLLFKDLGASNGKVHVIDRVLSPHDSGFYGDPSAGDGRPPASKVSFDDPNFNRAYVSGGQMPYHIGIYQSGGCKGMTWVVTQQANGAVQIGSDRMTNPYRGDTHCDKKRPILCHFYDESGAPMQSAQMGWSFGQVAATSYVRGFDLTSVAAADGICASEFGAGWKMAEFHLGGKGVQTGNGSGWQFWAYGQLALGQRYWVRISDQPANPWNSSNPYANTATVYAGRDVMSPADNNSWQGETRPYFEQRQDTRPWCKGMTWVVQQQYGGMVRVGSDSMTNAYVGDRSCPEVMPVLCINVTGAAPPANVHDADFTTGWSAGTVKMSSPVAGDMLNTREAANQICANQFGNGWRMAEFHDGCLGRSETDGWSFWAHDGGLKTGTRFWVAINDQPANPWNP